jgi:hypothetical protein
VSAPTQRLSVLGQERESDVHFSSKGRDCGWPFYIAEPGGGFTVKRVGHNTPSLVVR